MKRNLAYLKYVLRHKWFVLCACKKMKVPIWQGIRHDLSKFLPREWFPYGETFYGDDGSKRYVETIDFNQAWNRHQKNNPHHWQYWVLLGDNGEIKALPMLEKYVREMVADWVGASKAITGSTDISLWYSSNKSKMHMHRQTRALVETLLRELDNNKYL